MTAAIVVDYNVHIPDVSMYHAFIVTFAQLFHCTTKVEHFGVFPVGSMRFAVLQQPRTSALHTLLTVRVWFV